MPPFRFVHNNYSFWNLLYIRPRHRILLPPLQACDGCGSEWGLARAYFVKTRLINFWHQQWLDHKPIRRFDSSRYEYFVSTSHFFLKIVPFSLKSLKRNEVCNQFNRLTMWYRWSQSFTLSWGTYAVKRIAARRPFPGSLAFESATQNTEDGSLFIEQARAVRTYTICVRCSPTT